MGNPLTSILSRVFGDWDVWIRAGNAERRDSGALTFTRQTLRIVGQMAVLLAEPPFPVTTTMDIDLTLLPEYECARELERILLREGIRLERDAHLIWMPPSTCYGTWKEWDHVTVLTADLRSVMVSKYRFNRPKDAAVLATYAAYDSGFRTVVTEAGISWRREK